jgi:hypothetical protein
VCPPRKFSDDCEVCLLDYAAPVTNPRFKPLVIAAVSLFAVWALAFISFRVAAHLKMTSEKMAAEIRATTLEKLDAAARARRLRALADKLNQLSGEERRRARRDRAWDGLWVQMTEEEKADFIERTMPTGFKQMINAFEKLTEDKRRQAITNTLARLQKVRDGELPPEGHTDQPPLSDELQKKVITAGLKTFYSESSAQTKAEMAPVLDEMQRLMESGRLFR